MHEIDVSIKDTFGRICDEGADCSDIPTAHSASETIINDPLHVGSVRAIKDAHGRTVRVLGMDTSLAGFANAVGQVHFGQTGYLIVIGRDGTVLTNPRQPVDDVEIVQQLGGDYVSFEGAQNGDRPVMINGVCYDSVIYTSPELGWKYIGLTPYAEVTGPSNKLSALLLGSGLIAILATLFTTSTIFCRS